MRFHTLLLCMASLLIFTGCAPSSIEPGTATPNIMPRLDPSPTPSNSTLPLTCQITDLNIYINEADGYCFAYPTRFTLGDQPSDKPDVRGPALDDSAEPIHATLSVDVSPAASDKALREQAETFLQDFSVADSTSFTWTELQVGGEPGWMVEPVPAMLAYRIVFVQHDGKLFRLLYWPMDIPEAQADMNDLTQTTLASFAFTQ
jgi:hypothetical protein